MTSPSSGYRVVCPICQTVIVSPTQSGTFAEAGAAIRALDGHLGYSCEKAKGLNKRTRESVAHIGVEAITGAA